MNRYEFLWWTIDDYGSEDEEPKYRHADIEADTLEAACDKFLAHMDQDYPNSTPFTVQVDEDVALNYDGTGEGCDYLYLLGEVPDHEISRYV